MAFFICTGRDDFAFDELADQLNAEVWCCPDIDDLERFIVANGVLNRLTVLVFEELDSFNRSTQSDTDCASSAVPF